MSVVSGVNLILRRFDARVVRSSSYERLRDYRILRHAGSGPYRLLDFHLPTVEVSVEDVEITARVMEAFHCAHRIEKSTAASEGLSGDLWERIRHSYQEEFIDLLQRRDVQRIANILVNALHHPIAYGLCWDMGRLSWEEARSENARKLATVVADRFMSLAEAVGGAYVEFPEWGRWGGNIHCDLSEAYERVEQKIGLSLAIPECFGLYGIRAGKHTIPVMTPSHAYAAWRMLGLLNGEKDSRICEIGGGYGGCAYYAAQGRLGRYVIIDLLVVNVLQGYFLIKTCGSENVRLYGEDNDARAIHVLPYWVTKELSDASFDLTLNQESLPEIDRENARAYVREIARITRRYFLSINQESGGYIGHRGFRHNVVPALLAEHGAFARRYRFPWWIRKGVVEELYEIISPQRAARGKALIRTCLCNG